MQLGQTPLASTVITKSFWGRSGRCLVLVGREARLLDEAQAFSTKGWCVCARNSIHKIAIGKWRHDLDAGPDAVQLVAQYTETQRRRGRINITLRRAMLRYRTENYYQYNVGNGEVYK